MVALIRGGGPQQALLKALLRTDKEAEPTKAVGRGSTGGTVRCEWMGEDLPMLRSLESHVHGM